MATGRVVRKPLEGVRLTTGFIALKALVEFQVRTRNRAFEPLLFQVDSGTNVTTIPLVTAERLRILIPTKTIELDVHTAAGKLRQRVHPTYLTFRHPEMTGRDFVWPCHIVAYPGLPPAAALGLAGVLDDLRIVLDGTYTVAARYGWVILEEVIPDDLE
jgi:hypothetical protein